MAAILYAWSNTDLGHTADVEVPLDRAAACAAVPNRPTSGVVLAEICRAARLITETPGAVSASTASGWTVSRP